MAIYITGNKKIKNIFANVNGERKSISSVWVNKDNIPTKVFQLKNEESPDLYETAPADAYNNWNYTLNDEVNTITLNYYIGSETDVIVYGNYVINEKSYKTQIASNTTSVNLSTKYMFNAYAFRANKNIKTIKFNNKINTSNITYMCCMFYGCSSLTNLDLSSFDTSNVQYMTDVFRECTSLINLNLKNFKTNNTINMNGIFYNCSSLISLELSDFNTRNVNYMSNMFYGCSSLTNLDLSSFDTSNVQYMPNMFYGCSKLTQILVSKDRWVIKSGCNIGNMFYGCGCNTVTYVD